MLLFALTSAGYLGIRSYYPIGYEAFIKESASYHKVDPVLIAAVIRTESRFREEVVSSKGAQGLMQLTEATAKWAAVQNGIDPETINILDPKTNINLGSWYLSYLIRLYDGDMVKVLSGYNAGTGNVKKWLSDKTCSNDGQTLSNIPFAETENYIQKVQKFEHWYSYLYSEKLEYKDISALQTKK
nr:MULTISPECIES: lytic transglycosylase domain-containing protein [unclassified Fusibacter]